MNYHRQLNIILNTNGQIKGQNQMQCSLGFPYSYGEQLVFNTSKRSAKFEDWQ